MKGTLAMERQIIEGRRSRAGWAARLRRDAHPADNVSPEPMGLVLGLRRPRRNRMGLLRVICGFSLLSVLAAGTFWTTSTRRGVLDRGSGQFIQNFELVDVTTGRIHRLSDQLGQPVVIVFIGTSCPVGDLYMPRLTALATTYQSRGVHFLAVDSNASESIEDIARYARDSGANFPVLRDSENRVADQLLAERTCEVLVLDGQHRLRYRGAIDDQYGRRTRRDQPDRTYLVDAIEALLGGQAVAPELTQVVGCPIERQAPAKATRPAPVPVAPTAAVRFNKEPTPSPSSPNRQPLPALTFADDVAPILHNRCASCHRPGQVAPFPLLTYEHARRWSTSIAEVLEDGRMPPWHADPRYGHFSNDRSLSDRERSILLSWVEQGAPSGDLARAPSAPKPSEIWSIGTPDVVFEVDEPFSVPAEGTVPIRRVRVATHLEEDLYVCAAEARPGDRSVVHHIVVFVEDPNKTTESTLARDNLLVAYFPGETPTFLPPGVAKRIPRGSDLLFEVHYTPIGKRRFDRPSIGLVASHQPPRHVASSRGIPAHHLRIPPGDPDYVVRTFWTPKRDIQLLSLEPHMHMRGKSFTYTAEYPDGRTEIVLSVPRYDFNWQTAYRLTAPIPIPKGSKIHCEAHYDNSPSNPANPDPTRTVTWGEQSWDEMMIGLIDYY